MNGSGLWITKAGDWLLGWTLCLPRDATLGLIACFTVVLLLVIRYFTTDRAALVQLKADERRLRELRQQARAAGDLAALQRQRTIRRLLAAHRLRLEWLPVIVGLLPTLFLLNWASRRLEYLPLQSGESFESSAMLPASAIGGHAYVVPQPQWETDSGWIQPITANAADGVGVAVWRLRVDTAGATQIVVRTPVGSFEHPIDVGLPTYQPPLLEPGRDVSTRVLLTGYRPFGVVPGIAWLGLPAWSVGLLLLAIPMYLVVQRLIRLP